MFVIKNGKNTVSTIKDGMVRYAIGDRKAMSFRSVEDAERFWNDNAVTLPRVGESNVRVVPSDELAADSLLGQYETASGKPFTVEAGDRGILWKRTPGGQEEQTDVGKLERELADGKIRRAVFVELK